MYLMVNLVSYLLGRQLKLPPPQGFDRYSSIMLPVAAPVNSQPHGGQHEHCPGGRFRNRCQRSALRTDHPGWPQSTA